MPSPSLKRAFGWSLGGLCASLALSLAAAYWHSLPHLIGFSGQNALHERDFWCALAGGGFALTSGALAVHASRSATSATFGGVIAALVGWVGLTALLLRSGSLESFFTRCGWHPRKPSRSSASVGAFVCKTRAHAASLAPKR
jgi:hypothetical protein